MQEQTGLPLKPGLLAQQELRQTPALLPGAAGADLSPHQHQPEQTAQVLLLLEGTLQAGW